MVNVGEVLRWLYPAADPLRDYSVEMRDGEVVISRWNEVKLGPQPTAQQIADAALPAVKASAVAANRAEAARRIEAKWPDRIQRSAALGVYPQAVIDTMRANIASVIQAENAAADAIDSCATVAAVQAVTVNWPVI